MRSTEGGFLKRTIRVLSSLKVRFLVVFALAAVLAVVLFFVINALGTQYIENVYKSEEEKKAREWAYIFDLQGYVAENKISSEQAAEISQWAEKNRYVYLLLYKNDELFYTSDYKPAPSPDPDAPDAPDASGSDVEGEGSGGITVDYPTREELFEYARENGVHPLEFEDGTMFASVAEFTEYFYYDLLNIISITTSALVVIGIMLLYIQLVTSRIIRLGIDVNKVAEGDTGRVISVSGHDEISTLASNVDSMRSSMIENFEKEREAIDANNALITSMSHDIRTPLTVLLGYMDVMRAHAEGDAQMQSYIKAAESTAMRLKKLSDDMFGYFLVFGSRDVEVNVESYDAQMLLSQLISEHVLLMSDSGYTVEENVSELSLVATLDTDVQKLVRIIDNVFSNIYKYADQKKTVKIEASADACQIKLVFSNSIANERELVESNGIGLKTCKKLAELIGAKFFSETLENKFYANITLPITIK